jgi:hypothetical protein
MTPGIENMRAPRNLARSRYQCFLLLGAMLGCFTVGFADVAAQVGADTREVNSGRADTGVASSVRQRFEELDREGDRRKIVRLWQEQPFQVIRLIEAYLEVASDILDRVSTKDAREERVGEDQGEEDRAKENRERVVRLHGQALRAALAADVAFETVIFSDYVSAVLGWGDKQRELSRRNRERLRVAQKHLAGGKFESANYSTASLLAKALQADRHLLASLLGMGRSLLNLKAIPRALNSVEAAIELARKMGETTAVISSFELYAKIHEGNDNAEEARRIRQRISELRKATATPPSDG